VDLPFVLCQILDVAVESDSFSVDELN